LTRNLELGGGKKYEFGEAKNFKEFSFFGRRRRHQLIVTANTLTRM
jgi:hypothetical protein